MTFNPVDLAFLDSSGNYLKHVSSNGSVHTYQKYFPDGTADDPENKVTYNSSDRKWRDTGTDHPYGFKINTSSTTTAPYNTGYDTVSVATLQNNTQYVHMNTSTQGGPWATVQMDGWSATGGGTSTEGVLVQSATIVGGTFEQRGYPVGNYGLTSHLPGNGVYNHQTFWSVGTATNDIQHTISNLADGSYWLSNNVVGLNSPETIVASTPTTPSSSKKVFCNFW